MKIVAIISFLFCAIHAYSEHNVKVYYQQTPNGFKILADNDEFCPISIKIRFSLTNLKSAEGNNFIFVVPARNVAQHVTNLSAINENRPYEFKFETLTNYGDHYLNDFEEEFEYYLPFAKNESYNLWQGYNGSFSHQNENALDFTMPVGTEIFSARDGIVVAVVQNYNRSCDKKECAKFNNYILIYHTDGTFAEYSHIKQNGSVVKKGEAVKIGQLIGYSGNVGWSSGPHLHLEIFLQKLDKRTTLKTKFLIGKGEKAMLLTEKESYKREY